MHHFAFPFAFPFSHLCTLFQWCQAKLSQIQQAFANQPDPNADKTAICCEMLLQLSTKLGPGTDILKPLVTELIEAIYMNFPNPDMVPYFESVCSIRSVIEELEKQLEGWQAAQAIAK